MRDRRSIPRAQQYADTKRARSRGRRRVETAIITINIALLTTSARGRKLKIHCRHRTVGSRQQQVRGEKTGAGGETLGTTRARKRFAHVSRPPTRTTATTTRAREAQSARAHRNDFAVVPIQIIRYSVQVRHGLRAFKNKSMIKRVKVVCF